MQDNDSTSLEAPAGEPGAGSFMKQFPPSAFNPHACTRTSALTLGPPHTWVCDGCGEKAGRGVVVFSDPGNPRRFPQGTTCAINVYCRKDRPRHQAYEMPLSEFDTMPAVLDWLRQLFGKGWFGTEEAHELCDRYLRGLHMVPSSR
jgi:hypothetical protein